MDFKYTLEETLEARFDDKDEMSDIATHGAMSGFSDFTYTYDINKFFAEYENEIETYYYDIFGGDWMKDSGAADCDNMDSLRAHLVWGLIEMWCSMRLDEEAEE